MKQCTPFWHLVCEYILAENNQPKMKTLKIKIAALSIAIATTAY
jgi:hypothetical protein